MLSNGDYFKVYSTKDYATRSMDTGLRTCDELSTYICNFEPRNSWCRHIFLYFVGREPRLSTIFTATLARNCGNKKFCMKWWLLLLHGKADVSRGMRLLFFFIRAIGILRKRHNCTSNGNVLSAIAWDTLVSEISNTKRNDRARGIRHFLSKLWEGETTSDPRNCQKWRHNYF